MQDMYACYSIYRWSEALLAVYKVRGPQKELGAILKKARP